MHLSLSAASIVNLKSGYLVIEEQYYENKIEDWKEC